MMEADGVIYLSVFKRARLHFIAVEIAVDAPPIDRALS